MRIGTTELILLAAIIFFAIFFYHIGKKKQVDRASHGSTDMSESKVVKPRDEVSKENNSSFVKNGPSKTDEKTFPGINYIIGIGIIFILVGLGTNVYIIFSPFGFNFGTVDGLLAIQNLLGGVSSPREQIEFFFLKYRNLFLIGGAIIAGIGYWYKKKKISS